MFLHRYLGLVRALLLVVGLGMFVVGIDMVASIPTPPPESDGFLEGLAYIFALLSGVTGLVTAQIGYTLPAGIGRFRAGPLSDRSAGIRGGIVVVLYILMALLMVYVIPRIVPSVTESTTYATGLFMFGIAAAVGGIVTVIAALGSLLIRVYCRQTGSDESSTTT